MHNGLCERGGWRVRVRGEELARMRIFRASGLAQTIPTRNLALRHEKSQYSSWTHDMRAWRRDHVSLSILRASSSPIVIDPSVPALSLSSDSLCVLLASVMDYSAGEDDALCLAYLAQSRGKTGLWMKKCFQVVLVCLADGEHLCARGIQGVCHQMSK